ncbi:MAG: hypothetical protein QM758_15900 [Armatimonas sp.]
MIPFRPGEGATFPGGPGRLPLRMTKIAGDSNGSWLIEAGTFRYFLDARAGSIAGAVDGAKVGYLRPSVPLTRMGLKHKTPADAVIANEFLTLGFQADGLLVLVPHKALACRLYSMVANSSLPRLDTGRLYLQSEKGGLSLLPEAPVTPSRPPTFEILTPKKELSANPMGWEARWRAVPGQRLGMGLIKAPKDGEDMLSAAPQVISSTATDLAEQVTAARDQGHEAVVRMDMADFPNASAFLQALRYGRLGARADGVVLSGLDTLPWPVAYAYVRQAREAYPRGKILLPPPLDEEAFPTPPFISAYIDGVLGGV